MLAANTHKKTYRNRISNGGFEDRLTGWGSAGARVITAEEGHLVHSGTQAVMLQATNAFVAQTVPAGRGGRYQVSLHLRGVQDRENSPVLVRLRWVDATGSFLGTALEIYVAQKQLARNAWSFLNDCTEVAPVGTSGLNVRLDAPYAEGEAAIVVDDISVR